MKRVVVTLASAGLVLSACSSAGEAANVNGESISLNDVSAVQADIEETGTRVANIDALLAALISAEASADVVKERGIHASAESFASTEEQLGLSDVDYSDQTKALLDFYALAVEAQSGGLTEEDVTAVNESITGAKVHVNPRFGAWDSATGSIGQSSPEYRVR